MGNYKGDVLNGHCGLRPAPVRACAGGGAQSARVRASHFPLFIGLLRLFSVFQALEFHCGITVPQFSAVKSGRISEYFLQILPVLTHQRLGINFHIPPSTIHEPTVVMMDYLLALSASFLIVIVYIHISFSLISRCTSSATSITL